MSQNFNGGWIKASQEALNLLISNGNQPFEWKEAYKYKFYSVFKNLIHGHTNDIMLSDLREIVIDNSELSWDKPSELQQICDNPDVMSVNTKNEYLVDYDELQKTIDEADITPGIEKLAEGIAKDPSVIFAGKVYEITNGLAEMLISKNAKYGNSALEPKRIFSKASAVEQILVRIDDKISRMSNQDDLEDEDVVEDLLGYLVLLKIAKNK